MYHRGLQIGRPERDKRDPGPDLSLLAKLPVASWGMEVSRTAHGQVDFRLTAPDTEGLNRVARVLEHTFPHVAVLGEVPCAAPSLQELFGWRFARARPHSKHHYWPLNVPEGNDAWATDYADTLVSILGDPSLGGAEIRVQVLARQVGAWEAGLFSSRYEKLTLGLQGQHNTLLNGSWKSVPTAHDLERLKMIEARHHTPAFHVEVRAAWRASPETKVLTLLRPWLDQWTSVNLGGAWRYWDEVRPWPIAKRRAEEFARAFAAHDLSRFATRREARDVTAEELATMLAPPWRRDHARVLRTPEGPTPTSRIAHGRWTTHSSIEPSRGLPATLAPGEDSPFIAEMRRKVGMPKPVLPPPRPALGSGRAQSGMAPSPSPPPPATTPSTPPWVLGRLAGIDLALPDNWRHMGVVGGTGTGKSTLLLNLVLQAVNDPNPGTVVVLDPTGSLVRDVKARLPLSLARETVEFDPSQLFFTQKGEEWVAPGFNFLDLGPEVRGNPAAFDRATSVTISDLIRSFHDAWGTESVGARAGYFMTAILKGLMKRPGSTLLDVRDIITNKDARERYLRWLPPGSSVFLSSFVKEELPKYRLEDFISTLDKTGWFAGSHLLSGALCQRENPANFADFLDHRLVLLNVSRGLVGDQNCRILGSAFLSMLWSERLTHGIGAPPLTLVIDEAQTFALPSLAQMLSEGRKYGVRIVLANQYFAQLPNDLRAALDDNVGVWCCFRTGPDDARAAHKVTQASRWDYAESRFTWLPDHQFVCNVPTHSNQGFWQTSPPPTASTDALASERLILEAVQREFATRETSEASPFLVDNSTLGPVVLAVSEGTGMREAIATELSLPAKEVYAALRRAEDLGYITWDSKSRENQITELGRVFADAWQARRVTQTEGELHMDLLSRAAEYLREKWGVQVAITPQGSSSKPLPDATFEFQGREWVLEVECSTLATKVGQVVRNLQKAYAAHQKPLFVVRSKEALERLEMLLTRAELVVPEESDVVVLFWDGRFQEKVIHPVGIPPNPRGDDITASAADRDLPPGSADRQSKNDRDALAASVSALRSKGLATFTAKEVLAGVPDNVREVYLNPKTGKPTSRLGSHLGDFGIVSKKVWDSEGNRSGRLYMFIQPENGADGAESESKAAGKEESNASEGRAK
jgi:hypothetical protein